MFDNIGDKIKTLAMISSGIGIAASVIGGFVLLIGGDLLLGLVVAVVGSLLFWVGSFVLYGLGDLIETNRMILARMPVVKVTENISQTPDMAPDAPTPTATQYSVQTSVVHKWRCDNCGKIISEDICPFCGKAYGRMAEKIEELGRLRQNGTITPAEYEKRVEKIRFK